MARREKNFHLHDGEVHASDHEGRCTRGGYHGSGIDLTVTRKGVEVGGWYDGFVGIGRTSLTWEQLDDWRAEVNERRPKS